VPFSSALRIGALVKSRRKCCVCGQFAGRDAEVHHIVQEADGGPNTINNAIVLCSRCHGEAGHYNPRHPRGTKYSPAELRRHRDAWWRYCETLAREDLPPGAEPITAAAEVRVKVGTLWSCRADIRKSFEVLSFEAEELGGTRHETLAVVRFQRLYRRGDEYLVYEECNYRGDWATGHLTTEAEGGGPLTLDALQEEYPGLVSACGLPRVRRV
jgi:hypothetical protein